MYKPQRSKKYTCGKCRNKIPLDDMDQIFVEQLKQFHFDESEIAAATDAGGSAITEREKLLALTAKESQKLAAKMGKTYELFLNDTLDAPDFVELYQPLKDRHRELGLTNARLQGELDALRIAAGSSDVSIEDSRVLYSH